MINGNGTKRGSPKRRTAHAARSQPPVQAVVLAGGKGTRLAPYTSILPKPLMPIGDRSILEIVLGQLAGSGIQRASLCVGYLAHLIEAVIGDRTADGLEIRYVREEEALGTAAPLRLVPELRSTFLAMNGDILTDLNYNDLVEHHRASGNLVTIATHKRPIKIDYGVLRVGRNGDSHRVRGFREKPEMTSMVSMGIYMFEPRALDFIPSTGYFDFPQLVLALLDADEPVGVFPFSGLWFDIGRRDDYERAAAVWLEHQLDGESDPAFPLVTGSE
jgi:NDP-sugar pyrophosphorylase family protein